MSVAPEYTLTGSIDPSFLQPVVAAPEKRSDFMRDLHNQGVMFDENSPGLYPADNIKLFKKDSPLSGEIVSEVAIPGEDDTNDKHFAIVRLTRRSDSNTGFALVGLETDPDTGNAKAVSQDPNSWVSLNEGSNLTIGRGADALKGEALWDTPHSRDVSRQHIIVSRNNGKILLKDVSSNGSKYNTNGLVAPIEEPSNPDVDEYTANHTLTAEEFAELRRQLRREDDGRKTFWGRETIGRDSEIGGTSTASVDIRSWQAGAEAIVVDGKRAETKKFYDAYVDGAMGKLQQKAAEKSRNWVSESDVTQAIFETISERMQYDLDLVNDWSKRLHQIAPDHRKVDLSAYLEEGKGVCRHMALMAAWLGGEFKAMGYLTGKLTAEVNQRSRIGAHEWARYTDVNGNVTIIDPAQQYYGPLENAQSWDYRRDEEKRGVPQPPPVRKVDLRPFMDENGVIVRAPGF